MYYNCLEFLLFRWVKDPAFLQLWHRPAAVAQIQSLVWELPYAAGEALKSKKKKERERIMFYSVDTVRILAWETTSQITLRDCSQAGVKKQTGYIGAFAKTNKQTPNKTPGSQNIKRFLN